MIVSIGTSGVVCAVSATPTADPSGTVAGFASATGDFLPLIATINAARVLDAIGVLIGADHDELSRLALAAPSGADGLALVPYFEGERTPNRPDATGALHGMRLHNTTRGASGPGRGRGSALRAGGRARRDERARRAR